MSRIQLWSALGAQVSLVAPALRSSYERESAREISDPPGHPATSFYLSGFPGREETACGRAAVYHLMGVPGEEFSPRSRAFMNAGKAIELDFVHHLAMEGVLLSGDEVAGEDQHRVTDPRTWASGAVDVLMLPAFWRKSHVVEIKTTSAEKVAAMRKDIDDTPFSHAKYLRQIGSYVAYLHEQHYAPEVAVCSQSWALTREFPMGMRFCPVHRSFDCETRTMTLEPPDDGTLLYASRDDPLDTVSHYVTLDLELLIVGRERLASWRESFLRGELPPHPLQGRQKMWSADPCRYCGYKKLGGCKLDYEQGVTELARSNALAAAAARRPSYDYDAQRAAVLARWDVDDPLAEKQEAA